MKPIIKKEEVYEEQPRALQQPSSNFATSGLLAATQNHKNGIPLAFSLHSDSTTSSDWRLYRFESDYDEAVTIKLRDYRGWLFGKDRKLEPRDSAAGAGEYIEFIAIDNPSCSRQHAVLIFRNIGGSAVPYLLDLRSTNGTTVNGELLNGGTMVELRDRDVIRFGLSKRDWVLMREK